MKKFYSICRRSLALFTAAVMCAGMLQISALADGMEDAADEREIEVHTVTVDVDDSRSAEPASTENSEDDSKNNETPASNEDDDKSKDANETEGTEAQNSDDETPAGTKDGVDQEDPKDQEGPKDPEDTASEEQSEETEESKEAEPFPADGTEEEQKQWYQENVERPGQTDVTTTPVPTELPNKAPSDEEQPGEEQPGEGQTPAAPVVPDGWEVFYNEEKDCYELTFEIDEDAEGDQTIDLTKALELLNQYANDIENVTPPTKPTEPTPVLSDKDQEALDEYQAAKDTWDTKTYPDICEIVEMFNYPGYIEKKGLSMEDVVAEFNSIGYFEPVEIPVKPNINLDVDKDSPEYQQYLKDLADYDKAYEAYKRQQNANVLQPGDIRKFEIYLTSKSGHTYKYKDGSFILATPDLSQQVGDGDTVEGFDGQILPGGDNGHTNVKQTYTVSAGIEPLLEMLTKAGIPESMVKISRNFEELLDEVANRKTEDFNGDEIVKEVAKVLGVEYTRTDSGKGYAPISYEFTGLADAVKDYLVKHYSELDGKDYKDLDEVFATSVKARNDVTATSNTVLGEKGWSIGGEKITASYGQNFEFNNFYQSLLSFIYNDRGNVEEMLGESNEDFNNNSSYHPEYAHKEWTNKLKQLGLDYSVALEQYMAHQKAWEAANTYFKDLLEQGLNEKDATWASFMMAVNIDGELTSNNWQLTKWGWYNSIQLEQMDFDFNLEKVDENGKLITSDKTGFQIWRMDVVKDENGNEVKQKVYCTQIPQVDDATGEITGYTYVFDATATAENAILYTENGKLDIANTLMKDIVYYLQEVVAPDGYDLDTTVYVIMDEDTAKDANWEELEKEAGVTLEYGEDGLPTSLIKVTTDENGVPRTETIQIVNTKKPEEPPKDPEDPKDPKDPEDPKDPDDPKDPRTPETPETPTIPTTEIPEEDIPLTEIPEEDIPLEEIPEEDIPKTEIPEEDIPLTEIPEEDIPLSDVPKTGDASQLWTMLTLFSGLGLVWLCLAGRKRERA